MLLLLFSFVLFFSFGFAQPTKYMNSQLENNCGNNNREYRKLVA